MKNYYPDIHSNVDLNSFNKINNKMSDIDNNSAKKGLKKIHSNFVSCKNLQDNNLINNGINANNIHNVNCKTTNGPKFSYNYDKKRDIKHDINNKHNDYSNNTSNISMDPYISRCHNNHSEDRIYSICLNVHFLVIYTSLTIIYIFIIFVAIDYVSNKNQLATVLESEINCCRGNDDVIRSSSDDDADKGLTMEFGGIIGDDDDYEEYMYGHEKDDTSNVNINSHNDDNNNNVNKRHKRTLQTDSSSLQSPPLLTSASSSASTKQTRLNNIEGGKHPRRTYPHGRYDKNNINNFNKNSKNYYGSKNNINDYNNNINNNNKRIKNRLNHSFQKHHRRGNLQNISNNNNINNKPRRISSLPSLQLRPRFNMTRFKTAEGSSLNSLNFWEIDATILEYNDISRNYFKYNEGSGNDISHITIKKDGVYIVYAQILFHDVKWRWSVGVIVDEQIKAKCLETEQLKELKDYYPNTHSVYKQCSIFTILRIKKDERVSIKDMYGDRSIHMHPEFTFWGLIKIM